MTHRSLITVAGHTPKIEPIHGKGIDYKADPKVLRQSHLGEEA